MAAGLRRRARGWRTALTSAPHIPSDETKYTYLGLDQFGIRLTAGTAGPIELSYRVLDSVPLGMALIDPAGRFQWANVSLCTLLGRRRDALLSTTVEQITHPDDLASASAVLAELLRGERTGAGHELRCVRPDGSIVWITASISIPTGADGSPRQRGPGRLSAVALQALDITDRQLAEPALDADRQDLRERKSALERSNRDLDDVAAILSHDLAEPLRVIAGHVSLLAARYGDRLDARTWIDFAVDGCTRMKALLDAVLAYSRVGQAPPPTEPTDSAAIVANVLEDTAALIESSGVKVTLEGDLPALRVAPAELGQVFANLVTNALRHGATAADPCIAIRTSSEGPGYRFEVEDNGQGVPARHRERIFRPFQRLGRATDHPGTGIGPAICRRAVERAGGRIGVAESPNGGTKLWFTLPGSRR